MVKKYLPIMSFHGLFVNALVERIIRMEFKLKTMANIEDLLGNTVLGAAGHYLVK